MMKGVKNGKVTGCGIFELVFLEKIIRELMGLGNDECADVIIEELHADVLSVLSKSIYVGLMLIFKLKNNEEELKLAGDYLLAELSKVAAEHDVLKFQTIISEAIDSIRETIQKPMDDKYVSIASGLSSYVLDFKSLTTKDKIGKVVGLVNMFIN